MSPSFTVRPYRESDLLAIVAVFRDAISVLGAAAYDVAQREAWAAGASDAERWGERVASQNALVAEEGGRILGFIAWSDQGEIDLLYTCPSAARRGVASRLYGEVERRAREGGVEELCTDASDLARPFFAAQGFTYVRTNYVTRNAQILRNHSMSKRLATGQG